MLNDAERNAERIVGSFWDVKQDGVSDMRFHLKLRDDFLNDTFLI